MKRRSLQDTTRRAKEMLAANKLDELLSFLQKAVRQFPSDPELRLMLGTRLASSATDEAAKHVMAAIEMDPGDPARLIRAAGALWAMGYVSAAEVCAHRAESTMPPGFFLEADLINVLGCLAWERNEYEHAEAKMRDALRHEPNNALFAGHLMRLLWEVGRTGDAANVMRLGPPALRESELLKETLARLEAGSPP